MAEPAYGSVGQDVENLGSDVDISRVRTRAVKGRGGNISNMAAGGKVTTQGFASPPGKSKKKRKSRS